MPSLPRLLTVVLFATSLALRAWVPAGWMPAPGSHSFAIMPCPAAAPSMPGMDHGSTHHDQSKPDKDCFSPLMAGAALPDPPLALRAPAPAQPVEPAAIARQSIPGGAPTPKPYPTGPPALA